MKLTGTGPSDLGGGLLTFKWTQIAGPVVNLKDSNKPIANFKSPEFVTEPKFKLVVNDGFVDSDPDVTQVIVSKPCD